MGDFITNIFYEVSKRYGFMPTDSLITLKPRTMEATIDPIKPMSGNHRRELLSVAAMNGWSLTIIANHSCADCTIGRASNMRTQTGYCYWIQGQCSQAEVST